MTSNTADGVPRELTREVLRNIYLIRASGAAFAVILLWIFYAAAAIWGYDLLSFLRFREQPKKVDSQLYLYIAVATTIIAPSLAAWYIRKALYFARHGILVQATVTATGSIKAAGQFDIKYRYEYQGRWHTGKASVVEQDSSPFAVGATLPILVHPRRPAQSKLLEDVIVTRERNDE